jgi:hypothetical protein
MAAAAVSLFVFFLSMGPTSIPTRASKKTLGRHDVVNYSAHQIGVFWKTEKAEVGWIAYGTTPQNLNQIALDERDVEAKKNTVMNHFVLLKNLTENTTYYYKIVTNDGLIGQGSAAQAFSFKTLPNISNPSSAKPAYGKVVLPNGQPAQESFVIITKDDTYPLVTMTKITGEWLIPLQYGIQKSTGKVISFQPSDAVSIEIVADNQVSAQIDAIIKNTTPLPQTVVMGRNYTFMSDSNVLPASTSVNGTGSKHTVSVLYPKEGAVVPGFRPLIKGTAVPGKQVKISINSNPGYVFQLTADAKGEWNISSPITIGAGSYIITLKTIDDFNRDVTLTRRFVIGKSGEAVLGDATPSGTITTTPEISPSVTPGGTTVTIEPSATETPTASVSGSLSPTPTLVAGFNSNLFLYGSAALIIIGAGVMFIF